MVRLIRIEQSQYFFLNSRGQIVLPEIAPVFKSQEFHHLFYRHRLVSYYFYQIKNLLDTYRVLVGYLQGTCRVLAGYL